MTVYATRLVNGTDTRERMRRADALGMFASGAGMARGGFRNDGGGVVTVNAGTMTVAVSPFTAWVDGGVSDLQGGYTFVSDTTETLTVSPGHASLSRTDVVIAEVRDTTHDGSGSTDARVRILEGTPGSGTPALPTNALALRNITVAAGTSAGTGGLSGGALSTDRRTYTTGLGGVLSVASQAERDALPQTRGTVVYRTDTDALEMRRAAGWVQVARDGTYGGTYSPNVVNLPVSLQHGNYAVAQGQCSGWARWNITGAGGGPFAIDLPVPALSGAVNALLVIGKVRAIRQGVGQFTGNLTLNTQTTASLTSDTAVAWTGSFPATWANGDSLACSFSYPI